MKKKSKFLLCLISMTVLSSVVLFSGLSVSAKPNLDDPGEYELKGQDLFDFLRENYAVVVGVSDSYDDWSASTQWLDPNTFEYQFVWDYINDNVYITLSFPNINGVNSPIKGKYYIVKFQSYYTSLNGVPYYNISSLNMDVYKRIVSLNGDVTDGDSEPLLSVVVGTNNQDVSFETNVESYPDLYDFPLLNQTSLTIGNTVVSPWIDTVSPYQTNTAGSFKFKTYDAAHLTVDYDTMRDSGYVDEGLRDIAIIYTSGNTYVSGAIQLAIEPISLTISGTVDDPLLTPSPSDKVVTDDMLSQGDSMKNEAGSIKDSALGVSGDLGNISTEVANGVARPSFDIDNFIGLAGLDSVVGGLASFRRSTVSLFGNGEYYEGIYNYENPTMLFFLAPSIPALLISYLLFGKKG